MNKFMAAAARVTIICLVIYVLVCAVIYMLPGSFIYFPQSRIILKNEINLKLPTAAGDVLVSTRPHSGKNAIIYFGGNAEEVSLNLPDFSSALPRHALYLMHYRGFGGSAGKPTEAALISDALALFDKVYAEHENVILFGRSLGTGIALQVASLRPAAKLILVTPYDSLIDLASSKYPYIPVRWLLKDTYESRRYAPKIHIPVLILAAEEDSVVSREQTMLLHSHLKPNLVSFNILPNTSHNSISESPRYLPLIQEFCK